MEKLIAYIADDGVEFDNEEDCILYEKASADPDNGSVLFLNHNLEEGLEENFSIDSAIEKLKDRCDYDFGDFSTRAGSMFVRDEEKAAELFRILRDTYGCNYPDELISGASYAYDTENDRFVNLDELIEKLTNFRNAIRKAAGEGVAA